MPPSPSSEEAGRLKALYRYDILDTPREEQFDRVARLARRYYDVPIVLLAFLDADRQWFKSAVGLERRETDREVAFCAYHIYDDELFVVEDATQDPRFRENPLVTGPPGIRFYAGAPLLTPTGYGVGSLCLIDTEPRRAEGMDLSGLRDLATIVVDELELRTLGKELEERNRQVQYLLRTLINAEEKERDHLSQLLHEELQQGQQAARLKLENFISSASLTGEQAEKLRSVIELIEDAMHTTQGLSARFAPPIANQSLRDTFDWLTARMKEIYSLTVSIEIGGFAAVTDETLRMLLYRTVRELLFSVVKHTNADEVFVTLTEKEQRLRVVLEHDGTEGNLERGKVMDPGLEDICERLEALEGTVDISSRPGEGGRVVVEVPTHIREAQLF